MNNLFVLNIKLFLLILVLRYASVHYAQGVCCYGVCAESKSDAGFELKVRCQNVVVDWHVRSGHLHEPKQQFSSAVGKFHLQSQHRNFHQGLVGFLVWSKWTSNVQELLTLCGECWNSFDMIQFQLLCSKFKLITCSHFQVWCSRFRTQNKLTSFQ